jgi:hypothetical protein
MNSLCRLYPSLYTGLKLRNDCNVRQYEICNRFLGAFAKLRKATISFVMSVRPTIWSNSNPNRHIFKNFHIWVFFEYTSLIKTRQERVICMKTLANLRQYLAESFLERALFKQALEKIYTHILRSTIFSRKSWGTVVLCNWNKYLTLYCPK